MRFVRKNLRVFGNEFFSVGEKERFEFRNVQFVEIDYLDVPRLHGVMVTIRRSPSSVSPRE